MAERNRLRKQDIPDRLFTEWGATGLKHFAGRVDEEWLAQLASSERRLKQFREMRDNDPVVGAVLFAIEMLVRQVSWYVEPFDKSNERMAEAEFVEQCLKDMSITWEDTVAEILSMLAYGFSVHEIVYKRRLGYRGPTGESSRYNDGFIGWRKLPIRAQDTIAEWDLDEAGGVKGVWQEPPPDYQRRYIPIERLLLFRTGTHKGNPEGRSILRNAFRPWFFKKRIEEVEGIGIERDLAGLPVIYAPARIMSSQASPEEKAVLDELKRIVTNIRRDEQEGIIMPGNRDERGNLLYELKLLSTGGQRQFNTNEIIARYDQRIAVTVLADFILLGQQRVGSYALSSSKTELFATAIGTYLRQIAAVMNQYAIPRLMQLNGITHGEYPELRHGDIEVPDLRELGDFIARLAGAGMPLFPDQELENKLRTLAKLPLREFEEEDGSVGAEQPERPPAPWAATAEPTAPQPPESEEA